ncbi:sugar phosphate isomerase/epimerase family protein [Anaerocolumna sp. MB42-C2]|uniref:sugar phosphate isomerase/epimerase family protein n=1 Tax=Anaerocolumna sp. MB42-C2 TaxID=3070997 RepID=UPI0027DF9FC9|nr:sugar phosphate isomerase/epimerase [Anaerocolumna sp. MB42-C2]WMJ87598.1 sugar phosphate isomerase/epimerase [Anaerocolumna sp. MB42-C2]
MKYGCCVNMFGEEADPVGIKYITYLAECGYDYVELPLAQVMELSSREFGILKTTLKNNGIGCECCNNFFPASIRLTGENTSPAVIEEYIQKACTRAAELDAKVIVFGSSGAKNVPEGYPMEEAFHQIAEVLKIADKYAFPKEIQIAIEPLNHKESNIIINLSDSKKLMKAADASSIRLLVDYYHFMVEKESIEAIKENGADIIHVHFAEQDGRSFPKNPSEDYRLFFDTLRKTGYDSRISIEAYSSQIKDDMVNALRIMKNL